VLLVAGVGAIALWPRFAEWRLMEQLRDDENDGWRAAADELIERRSTRALPLIVETVLTRDVGEFENWEKRLRDAFDDDFLLALSGFAG
jgi:hypothetical protein